MDLAVRRQPAVVGEHERVHRSGRVIGDLEHAGQPGRPGAGAQLAQAGGEGPVQRLGVRREVGARLAEVASERLGEHHQVRPLGEGCELVEDGAVLGRVEAGRTLDEADVELVGGLVCHVSTLPAVRSVAQAVGRCQTADVNGGGTTELGAVVLSGGSAVRFQGADKASIEIAGVTLLEHVLGALAEVPEVVVVGDEVLTSRPVSFVREDPPGGGPAAGLLAGLAGFPRPPRLVVVLAVDMPLVTTATVSRLMLSAEEDGALLVDGDGRQQYLCAVYRAAALIEAAPTARGAPRAADAQPRRRATAGRGSRAGVGGARCRHVGRPHRAAGAARRLIRGRSKDIWDTYCITRAPPKTGDREPARLDRRAL